MAQQNHFCSLANKKADGPKRRNNAQIVKNVPVLVYGNIEVASDKHAFIEHLGLRDAFHWESNETVCPGSSFPCLGSCETAGFCSRAENSALRTASRSMSFFPREGWNKTGSRDLARLRESEGSCRPSRLFCSFFLQDLQ